MKYLITENKMHEVIVKVLKSAEPEIVDVEFGTRNVMLATKTDRNEIGDKITQTIIKVTIDNTDKHLTISQYKPIYEGVVRVINSFFSLDVTEYSSPYDVQFYVLEKKLWYG